MPTVVNASSNADLRRVIESVRDVADPRRLWRRTLARARRDLARLLLRHLKNEIRLATKRDTGALLRVRLISRQSRRGPTLTLIPTFPRTAYATPHGKGKPGASKRGQYAFVVNANPQNRPRHFIQKAVRSMSSDPEVSRILVKHALFIVQSIRNRNRRISHE